MTKKFVYRVDRADATSFDVVWEEWGRYDTTVKANQEVFKLRFQGYLTRIVAVELTDGDWVI